MELSAILPVKAKYPIARRNKIKARNYEYFFNRAQDKFELADYEEAILDYNKAWEH